jgi:aldose 1-epimerase
MSPSHPEASVTLSSFGSLKDGREALRFTLVNTRGAKLEVTNYGAIIVRLVVPDRNGQMADVTLGYPTLAGYLEQPGPYFGAVVGRVGNRIANGRFTLDGKAFTLATNNAPGGRPCHLHGGLVGFDKVLWESQPLLQRGVPGLRLTYLSRDGEEGYPGNLTVTVTYWLTNDNTVRVEYTGVTDQATPVNLTQHAYFNLRGEGEGDVLDHVLTLPAGSIVPADAGLIPTGGFLPVAGTPFDFTTPHPIGARIDAAHEQLRNGGGYDHTWVLGGEAGTLRPAATLHEPLSGRLLEVWTEEPGAHLYTGNFLDGSNVGKSGRAYPRRSGVCVETQHFADSPNQPAFPSTILRPGQTYRTATEFRFSTR